MVATTAMEVRAEVVIAMDKAVDTLSGVADRMVDKAEAAVDRTTAMEEDRVVEVDPATTVVVPTESVAKLTVGMVDMSTETGAIIASTKSGWALL